MGPFKVFSDSPRLPENVTVLSLIRRQLSGDSTEVRTLILRVRGAFPNRLEDGTMVLAEGL